MPHTVLKCAVIGWNKPTWFYQVFYFHNQTGCGMRSTLKSQDAKLLINLYSSVLFISASWAVMSYPEIQSVVLDASFDDLLPLALKVMPDSWRESSGV